jgi:hypothetical protein
MRCQPLCCTETDYSRNIELPARMHLPESVGAPAPGPRAPELLGVVLAAVMLLRLLARVERDAAHLAVDLGVNVLGRLLRRGDVTASLRRPGNAFGVLQRVNGISFVALHQHNG